MKSKIPLLVAEDGHGHRFIECEGVDGLREERAENEEGTFTLEWNQWSSSMAPSLLSLLQLLPRPIFVLRRSGRSVGLPSPRVRVGKCRYFTAHKNPANLTRPTSALRARRGVGGRHNGARGSQENKVHNLI